MQRTIDDSRPNLLIFGVGHSGTTIITQMLFELGWGFGGLASAVDDEYAEHIQVRDCNRFALQHQALPAEAALLLENLESPWAIKDPRFVLTLPYWESAFLTLSIPPPTLLWITRDLEQVKESYVRRREFVREQPGSHGHTVEELWEAAGRNFESWSGPKMRLDYSQLSMAAALFRLQPTESSHANLIASTSSQDR